VTLPSDIGFPYVVRLPLGIAPYPPPTTSFLESTHLPDYLAANISPAGQSDPYGTFSELRRFLRHVLKLSALIGPF